MIKIYLDGKIKAPLNWEISLAEVKPGQQILWKLDLGLFEGLILPLHHKPQFLSLTLSLEHFIDTIWKQFEDQTVGICLYEGPADFTHHFKWDAQQLQNFAHWLGEDTEEPWHKKLFCRDVCVAYLDLLVKRLPDKLQHFVSLDISGLNDPLERAVLTSQEVYGHTQILGIESQNDAKVAICLPPSSCKCPSFYQGLREQMITFDSQDIPYKVIPESILTTEWDGLDDIYVCAKGVTPTGERKLQGFIAAGGTVTKL